MVVNESKILTINTIEEAKNSDVYNGQPLDNEIDKAIFDDPQIKNDDGTVKDLNLLHNTVRLLANLKEAQANLETEKKSDKNLSADGNLLLDFFLSERRNESIAYQLVNEKDENEKGRVDKIIEDYQAIQFRRVNKELETKKRALWIELNSIVKKGADQDKKVNQAREKYEKVTKKGKYDNLLEEAIAFKTKVEVIKDALKADLGVGRPGRKILNTVVQKMKAGSNVGYRKDSPATANSLGSIIDTGVKLPYSDKRFAHPRYLSNGLPYQMKELFAKFDKDKLFKLIDNEIFKSDPEKAKKTKKAYDRVINANVQLETKTNFPYLFRDPDKIDAAPADKALGDYTMLPLNTNVKFEKPGGNVSYGLVKLFISGNAENAREGWNLFLTDILYFMNALFPKDTTDFSSLDILKDGTKALPFADSNSTLTSEHSIFWRGRIDNTLGGALGYRELFPNSVYPIDEAFPSTKLELSWAGVKGESIPEFFWQVYNSAETIKFDARRDVLDKYGNDSHIWENDFSAYEKKLGLNMFADYDAYYMAYRDRVKDIISGVIPINDPVTGTPFAIEKFDKITGKGLDAEVYWTDFEDIFYQVLTQVFRTFHTFRQESEGVTYLQLKSDTNKRKIPYMIENTKTDVSLFANDTGLSSVWNKMVDEVCEGKIDNAKNLRAAWQAELNKRTAINAEEISKRKELNGIESQIRALSTGKVDQLETQLDNLGKKLNKANAKSITPSEAFAIKSLYSLLQRLSSEISKPLDTKFTNYINDLRDWETLREFELKSYSIWKKLGNSFDERFTEWKNKEGKNFDEDAVRVHFETIRDDLKGSSDLSPEEKAELTAVLNYLSKEPELRKGELENVFNLSVEISQNLVDEWKNHGHKKLFKKDSTEIKKIVGMFNKLSATEKADFFTELKTFLSGKSGVPNFPDDAASEWDKSDYYFTLKPEYVIGAAAAYKIKHDSAKKKEIEDEMTLAKNDQLKVLDLTKYGNGQEFTEAGIILYYYEKLGGLNHSFAKQGTKTTPTSEEGFWRTDNFAAWLSGIGLLLLIGALGWAIHKRKVLIQWWNAPSELEEELDEDEEED